MQPRKWDPLLLPEIVKGSRSLRETLGKLGLRQAGGNYTQLKKYLELMQIDTSHFTGKGWNIERLNLVHEKALLSDIMVKNSSYQSYKLKKRLFQESLKTERCEKCGWAEKATDGRIPLELHHINGNRTDNRLENLQVLCPNCHSLQPNHRGKNIKAK